MENTAEIVIDRFDGVNVEDTPATLPKTVTNLALNGYGNGTFFRKRPGLTADILPSKFPGPINDMLYTALIEIGGAGIIRPDVLFVLYGDVGGGAPIKLGAGSFKLSATTKKEDYGAMNHNNRSSARLIVAGEDRVMITPVDVQADWNFISALAGAGDTYQLSTYAALDATRAYRVGVWHREFMFWGGVVPGNGIRDAARWIHSNFDDPITAPSDNDVEIEPDGRANIPAGAHKQGDSFYIGKRFTAHLITGADEESFNRERTRIPFGFAGMRSWTNLKDGTAIGFTSLGVSPDASAANQEEMIIGNIGIVQGMDGREIGDKILSLVRNLTVPAQMVEHAWVADYKSLNLTFFATGHKLESADQFVDFIVRDKDSGVFWPWKVFSAANKPRSFEYVPDFLYVGTNDGGIRKFDPGEAKDEGTVNFEGGIFWASPPMFSPFGKNVPYSIEYVDVEGRQDSGGQYSCEISTDQGAFANLRSFTIDATNPFAHIPYAGDIPAGNFQSVKINLPVDGVRSEITRIVIGVHRQLISGVSG